MFTRAQLPWFAAVCGWVLATAAVIVHVLSTHAFPWIDLDVYRWGGDVAFDQSNLYVVRHPETGLPFTYSPFAASMFTAAGSAGVLHPVQWSIISFAALGRMSWLLAQRRGAWLAALPDLWVAAVIAAAICLSQPGSSTIRLGQVGFILAWLVCEDFLVDRRRTSGILSAFAVAVKLTPGVFLLFELAIGRWRMFARGVATVLLTIGAGWLLLPDESRLFWKQLGPDVTTVGEVATEEHWSINAMVWRVFGEGGNDVVWLLLAVSVLALCLALARVWWLGDGRLTALGLVGLGSVLASPFSWSHHWILVAPLFVGLLAIAPRGRRHLLWLRGGVLVAFALLTTAVWWHVPRIAFTVLLGDHLGGEVAACSFLGAAALLIALAWIERPRAPHTR